jgi:hypothetical protein
MIALLLDPRPPGRQAAFAAVAIASKNSDKRQLPALLKVNQADMIA